MKSRDGRPDAAGPPEVHVGIDTEGHVLVHVSARAAHPHALVHLCGGLATAGHSIRSGTASRAGHARWVVDLVLERSGVRPPRGDELLGYLGATQAPTVGVERPQIVRRTVERAADGALVLTVRARDEVGLLAGLLRRFTMLLLFPVRVELHTADGEARDRFVLLGPSEQPPGPEAEWRLLEATAPVERPLSPASEAL